MDGKPVRSFTRVAAAIVIAAVVLSATILLTSSSRSSTTTSSVSACSLLTPDVMEDMAWNGAGREVPGLNQTAPPWDYQSIYGHIDQGWESLCQSPAFVAAIQAHGAGSFSSGGGFVNPSNPEDSLAGISVAWTSTTSSNCTQYVESWNILIVNGTVTTPSTSTSVCIYAGGAALSFQVLKTNVTVPYGTGCMVLEGIGHTCPTTTASAGTSASTIRDVELAAYQGIDYYAGNFSEGPYGPGSYVDGQLTFTSTDVWFTNSTIFCASPLYGSYATCPVDEPLPSVSW